MWRHSAWWIPWAIAAFTACSRAALAPAPPAETASAPAPPVWERVDADPELEAGRQVWLGTCVKCHAHGLAGAALHEFSKIYDKVPDSRDKDFIEGMVTWVFERT